jgi:hypothetical protein
MLHGRVPAPKFTFYDSLNGFHRDRLGLHGAKIELRHARLAGLSWWLQLQFSRLQTSRRHIVLHRPKLESVGVPDRGERHHKTEQAGQTQRQQGQTTTVTVPSKSTNK